MLHAGETPVALLAPGRGKSKKAFVWVYCTTNFMAVHGKGRAVLYDFTLSRSGEHPRRVLGAFGGTLVTDDFSGHHALHSKGVTPSPFKVPRLDAYSAYSQLGNLVETVRDVVEGLMPADSKGTAADDRDGIEIPQAGKRPQYPSTPVPQYPSTQQRRGYRLDRSIKFSGCTSRGAEQQKGPDIAA